MSPRRMTMAAVIGAALARAAAGQDPAVPAAGADQAHDPVLQALVAEALQANPDLLALQESVTAARSRPEQARALADPMLQVLYTNDGWSPSLGEQSMTTLAFMGSQELPWPGKRSLRGALAARDADGVELQLARARLGVEAAVSRVYAALLLSRERLRLVREQEQLWRQIEGVARARYAVGQGAQPDVLRVQIEVTRVEQALAELQTEAQIRVAEINRLTGRPAESPLETGARLALRPVAESLEQALARLRPRSPELRAASLAEERAALRVALAGKDYKPDFTVQAGYMNRGGLDPMWQAGLSVSLPLQRKRLASGLAEAEALARAATHLAQSLGLQLRFRTQERLAQLQATERITSIYAQGIVPQGRMSVDAAVANYQSGKVPFIAVLEALTTLYSDRATHLGLLASHEAIRASLEEASLESTSSLAAASGAGMAGASGRGLGVAAAGSDGSMGSGRSMP